MLICLPEAVVSVPSLCRKLFAKRIRPNTPINNLFPQHGPGKRGYEDWYSISLREGKATLRVDAVEAFVRVYLRDDDGEKIEFATARTRAGGVELTVRELEHAGCYFVIIQTDAVYSNLNGAAANVRSPIRYTLTVLQ